MLEIKKAPGDIVVISVHDEEEPIAFDIPAVNPSRYTIPGINAPKEVFKNCQFTFPDQKPIRYAVRRTKNNHPYVLIILVDAHTFMYGTEQMKTDEYGHRLFPDVQRIPVPISKLESIANEIERRCGFMGLKAHKGEITEQDIIELERKSIEFMRKTVADTNRLAKRSPLNVTPQARRRAWRLHKLGLLSPLPEWAEVNPDARDEASITKNCFNCGKTVRLSQAKCECGAILNWKLAVENGFVRPSDVPPAKRKEAGLEFELSTDTKESTAPPPAPQPVDDDDAVESLNASDLPPVKPLEEDEQSTQSEGAASDEEDEQNDEQEEARA